MRSQPFSILDLTIRPLLVACGLSLCLGLAAQSQGLPPVPLAPATAAERQAAWERHQELAKSGWFRGLEWENLGPVVQGGRIVDIESVPGQQYSFYVAYASGGLWKTEDNGVSFRPMFDQQPTLIMGDVAVAPSRPQTVWVGTGENNSSRSSYGGMGLFRSDDGGETWQAAGLEDSDRIGRILIHPDDPERVYVAVLGRLYTEGGQRGVYRTTDGGRSWQRVLEPAGGAMSGFVDLVMEPGNPRILYAAGWERSRRPWNFVEGGPGSGIWKSEDGGDSWQRLTGGFPQGEHVGRIGLSIAPSQTNTVYAFLDNQELLPEEQWDLGGGAVTAKRLRAMSKEQFLAQDPEEIESFIRGSDLDTELDAKTLIDKVESDEISLEQLLEELDDANRNLFESDIRGPELWRSDDRGQTWKRTHDEPIRDMVYTYGYYFGEVRVAPDDAETVYLLGVPLISSNDGGRSFHGLNGRGVHVDHQAMWIDPNFPDRLLLGNDGGLDVSYDGGKSWLKLDAEPVGQFYTVQVDMADPYNIYGGLQDNGVLMGSRNSRPGIGAPWRRIGGGDGMHIEVDPRTHRRVYLGLQFGFYRRRDPDGPGHEVRPRDKLGEPALRYNWQTPIRLSSHNPDILYYGANRLMRSMDRGETWTAISPDLTRSTERGDVPFATLTTVSESPITFGLLWAGTDDGLVHLSEDGGVSWREVGTELPEQRWVSRVVASQHERDRAYVSLNGYRDDDIRAYLYLSEDLGRTWTDIGQGLPAEAINVVREDPVNPEVLYVGSDRGVYVSLDRGQSWQGLGAGLPPVPVHDLKVHPRERELVAGTHGRSIWVLDVLPVQDLDSELRESSAHLFPVESVQFQRSWRSRRSRWFHRPEDDPERTIPFWTPEGGSVQLSLLDGDDRPLRTLEKKALPGVDTFNWDLLLDEGLALAAEEQQLSESTSEGEDKKKGRRNKKKKDQAAETEQPQPGARAEQPWAEAVRLGRPLYVTPGTYTLELRAGEAAARTELKVEAPEPLRPRSKSEPKIRGRKKGHQP